MIFFQETNYDMMLRDNVVDHFFPPLVFHKRSRLEIEEEFENDANKRPLVYTSFAHWRNQPDEIEEYEIAKFENKKL
jgi:hypothetical protein